MIDLKPFCHESKPRINVPWSADGHTFATDGVILVRVPLRQDVGERDNVPKIMGTTLGDTFDKDPAGWFAIPEFDVVEDVCPECHGVGWVTPITAYNEYDDQECLSCAGARKVVAKKNVEIAGVLFDSVRLGRLKRLPEIEVGPFGHLDAARFRFTGGDGLIMPVRP